MTARRVRRSPIPLAPLAAPHAYPVGQRVYYGRTAQGTFPVFFEAVIVSHDGAWQRTHRWLPAYYIELLNPPVGSTKTRRVAEFSLSLHPPRR